MPVNLSIKNAPDDIVERVRKRAKRNHRSLQGEILAIIDDATKLEERTPRREVMESNRASGLSTPGEATHWIRENRDSGKFNINQIPDVDLGPWPDTIGLRREDIYRDDAR
jgi:plasmid stability protein